MPEAVTSPAADAGGSDHGRPSGSYTWGSSPAEQRRLEQQLAVLRPHSTTLLDRVGVRPGWSTIDLGCGPGGILDLLAARVGPSGHVMGVDLDSGHAASARAFARDRSLANVQVVSADARRTGLPGAAFDLVHTRLVLVNISRPGEVVAEMARLAKPGGSVAALEVDALGVCYPRHPALDRLTELLTTAVRQDGADPELGRRLPHLFRDAGLPQRTLVPDLLRAIRPKLIARGLTGEAELDAVDAAARRHLADPDTLIVPVTYFLAWARRPA